MKRTTLDVAKILEQDFEAFERLDSEQQLIVLICHFEAYVCKDGWYEFFMGPDVHLYGVLKDGLFAIGDTDSAEVLQDFENCLQSHGVEMTPEAVWNFAYGASQFWSKSSRDWGDDFMNLREVRWRKLGAYLAARGFDLK